MLSNTESSKQNQGASQKQHQKYKKQPTKMEEDPAPPSPPPWAESRAKKLLQKDIEKKKDRNPDGTAKTPAQVFQMHTTYWKYDIKNFRSNLRNLRKVVHLAESEAVLSHRATIQFLEMFPPAAGEKNPRWDNSEAKRLLRIDIKEGRHKVMKPRKLRKRRREYEKFDPDYFRQKIYQEVKRMKQKYQNGLKAEDLEAYEVSDSE
jgi:hypothetical protein